MCRALLSLSLLLGLAPSARAHPIPKNNHDRTIVVHLTPRAVVVYYRLEVDELTAYLDLPRAEKADLKQPREICPVFLRYFAPVLADNLFATLDDKPLTFTCVSKRFKVLDHQRYDYRFEAAWEPGPGKKHDLALREGNYELDSASKVLLSVAGEGELVIDRATVPSAAVQAKAPEDRTGEESKRLRNVSAVFVIVPDPPLATYKGGLPPDPGPDLPGPEEGQIVGVLKPAARGEAATARSGPAEKQPTAAPKPGPVLRRDTVEPVEPTAPDEPGEPSSERNTALDLLFRSRSGLAMALLLAAGLGAVHALTPGHGKALVAGYLVGERGTVWHAVLLGLVTTLTHTAAVLALAAVAWFLSPDLVPAIETVLKLIGGLMIAGLGFWLLTRRLAGRADHFHFGGGHHHHGDEGHGHGYGHSHGGVFHSHDHVHPAPSGQHAAETTVPHGDSNETVVAEGTLKRLVWLGVSGGMVPCGEAFVLLIAAISAGQPQLGLPLLLAFSLGLSAVLVAIGIGVVYAKRHLAALSGESRRLQNLVRALPLIGAAVVTALGLLFCYDGVHGLKPK
jgi:ABC-type nickel/cobalt efflux system permease component RcnA